VSSLGLPVLLSVEEPDSYEQSGADSVSLRRTLDIVRDALSRRNIRALVVYYYVLYAGVTYLVFVFLQPVFETVVVDLGVAPGRVEFLLGWFYAAYSLVGAVLSYYTVPSRRTSASGPGSSCCRSSSGPRWRGWCSPRCWRSRRSS
jgi:hypothetical protein